MSGRPYEGVLVKWQQGSEGARERGREGEIDGWERGPETGKFFLRLKLAPKCEDLKNERCRVMAFFRRENKQKRSKSLELVHLV